MVGKSDTENQERKHNLDSNQSNPETIQNPTHPHTTQLQNNTLFKHEEVNNSLNSLHQKDIISIQNKINQLNVNLKTLINERVSEISEKISNKDNFVVDAHTAIILIIIFELYHLLSLVPKSPNDMNNEYFKNINLEDNIKNYILNRKNLKDKCDYFLDHIGYKKNDIAAIPFSYEAQNTISNQKSEMENYQNRLIDNISDNIKRMSKDIVKTEFIKICEELNLTENKAYMAITSNESKNEILITKDSNESEKIIETATVLINKNVEALLKSKNVRNLGINFDESGISNLLVFETHQNSEQNANKNLLFETNMGSLKNNYVKLYGLSNILENKKDPQSQKLYKNIKVYMELTETIFPNIKEAMSNIANKNPEDQTRQANKIKITQSTDNLLKVCKDHKKTSLWEAIKRLVKSFHKKSDNVNKDNQVKKPWSIFRATGTQQLVRDINKINKSIKPKR